MAADATGRGVPTYAGRISEITNVHSIKQGYTAPLIFSTGAAPSYDADAPRVRYVDNLRLALEAVAMEVGRGVYTALNDVGTIHFARWVIMPGDLQLLFCANFDGGFEQYIHDFVTITNSGRSAPDNSIGAKWMDLIWGNCDNYPGTTDFDAFLAWLEDSLIDTTLFFPTIDDVTVRDIAWFKLFRQQFATFDEAAQRVEREKWPEDLLTAYDTFKSNVNRIDVTDA